MGLIDKYRDMNEEEAINAMIADGLIVMEDPDPISGDITFSVTEKGRSLLPDEPEVDRIKRMSNTVYELWQHGMVEILFDDDDYANDSVVLTDNAFNKEKVMALTPELRMSLASIKKSFEMFYEL